MGRLQDKVAIVTGGASGIGSETVDHLLEEGAKVVIADLDEEGGKAKESEINDKDRALFVKLDVASEDGWKTAVKEVVDHFGRLDYLVNSAGISISKNIEDSTVDDFNQSFAINVLGSFLGMKETIKYIKENESGGSIVNIGSLSGVVGLKAAAPYSTSKGAVRLLSKSAAGHAAAQGYNIRINCVNPNYINTPMLQKVYTDEQIDGLKDSVPLGRLSEVRDVTNAIVYLLSDESSFLTGADLDLDGGMLQTR